jgi:hypothetical protein
MVGQGAEPHDQGFSYPLPSHRMAMFLIGDVADRGRHHHVFTRETNTKVLFTKLF